MKQVSGKNLAKIVTRHGWRRVRVRGSHHVFVKDGHRARLVIPIHGSQPLKFGLLRSLMKQAGLTDKDL